MTYALCQDQDGAVVVWLEQVVSTATFVLQAK